MPRPRNPFPSYLRHKASGQAYARLIFIGPKAQAILLPTCCAPRFSPIDSEAKRLEARHAARVTPESQGNRRGSSRKAKRKRPLKPFYPRTPMSR